MKYYRYHIVDGAGVPIESNIPTREAAETVVKFLEETDNLHNLSVVEEHVPQATGLGRDPDLH